MLRAEVIAGAGWYRSAGRGITSPEPGRSEVPHWVTTEEQARQAVRDEVARNVDIIKIWVDDRNGQYEKLSPELKQAQQRLNDLKSQRRVLMAQRPRKRKVRRRRGAKGTGGPTCLSRPIRR